MERMRPLLGLVLIGVGATVLPAHAQNLEPKPLRPRAISLEVKRKLEDACQAMVTGDFKRARAAAKTLPAEDPATAVVAALIEARASDRKSPWIDVLVGAWRKVGTPDLEGSGILPLKEQIAAPTEAQLAALERGPFLAQVGAAILRGKGGAASSIPLTPALFEAALAHSKESATVIEQAVAVTLLTQFAVPKDRRNEALGTAAAVIDRLGTAEAKSIHFALEAKLGSDQTDRTLDAAEIEALEKIFARPRYDAKMSEIYRAARDALASLPGPTARATAFNLAISAHPLRAVTNLLRRAEKTLEQGDPAIRPRTAKLLATLGDRMLGEASLIDQLTGARLLSIAAPHASDPSLSWRAGTETERTRALRESSQRRIVQLAVVRWPIPPLLEQHFEESAMAEVAMLERLTRGR